jgi:hypothetical protein
LSWQRTRANRALPQPGGGGEKEQEEFRSAAGDSQFSLKNVPSVPSLHKCALIGSQKLYAQKQNEKDAAIAEENLR